MGAVWAFVAITPILVLVSAHRQSHIFNDAYTQQAWFAAFFLGNVKLGKGNGPDEEGLQSVVIKEPYILTLLRGERATDEVAKGIRLESSDVYTGPGYQSLPLPDADRTNHV